MSGAHERRRYPRYDARRLPGVLDGSRSFETLKLSAGGALIRVGEELALAQPVHVAFDLEGRSFKSDAVVVFVGPDFTPADQPAYRIGLSFTATAREDHRLLRSFIEASLAGREDP